MNVDSSDPSDHIDEEEELKRIEARVEAFLTRENRARGGVASATPPNFYLREDLI